MSDKKCDLRTCPMFSRADEDLIDWENETITFGEFAKTILSAGYVKLSDVELDEEKINQAIREFYGLGNSNLAKDVYILLAHAICQQAKEIIKIKEN